jgi:hypothetical protein
MTLRPHGACSTPRPACTGRRTASPTPVTTPTRFVRDLDHDEWAQGFSTFQSWNSPWIAVADGDKFGDSCRRIEQLQPATIVSAHGPTITTDEVPRAFQLLRAVPTSPAPAQPGQPVLDQIVASLTEVVRRDACR